MAYASQTGKLVNFFFGLRAQRKCNITQMHFNVDFLDYFVSVNRRFFWADLTFPNTITMFKNATGDALKVDKSLQMKYYHICFYLLDTNNGKINDNVKPGLVIVVFLSYIV